MRIDITPKTAVVKEGDAIVDGWNVRAVPGLAEDGETVDVCQVALEPKQSAMPSMAGNMEWAGMDITNLDQLANIRVLSAGFDEVGELEAVVLSIELGEDLLQTVYVSIGLSEGRTTHNYFFRGLVFGSDLWGQMRICLPEWYRYD